MNTNTHILKRGIFTALAITLGAFGASSWAASTWTQNLVGDCTSSNVQSQACGGSPAVTVSGWSTGSGTTTNPTAGTTFAGAKVYNWGSSYGLGVVATNENSGDTGPHAIDNAFGIDALLINFTSGPVNFSSVNIGWNGTDNGGPYADSDLSVLAWTGTGAPNLAGTGLLSSGWTLIGNYADVGNSNGISSDTTNSKYGGTASISSTVYSSYWLVSAYSSSYPGGSANGGSLDAGNDSFKVLSVAGNTCTGTVSASKCTTTNQTPEPGSLALLGAGVVGLLAARRRKAIR